MTTILAYILKLIMAQLQKYVGRVVRRKEIEASAEQKIQAIHDDYLLQRARDATKSVEDRIRDRLRR